MVKPDRFPELARRVLIGANPRAGAGNRKALIESLCQELFKSGFEPTVHAEIDDLAATAARLQEEGNLRAAVAAGGDGTFRLLAERTAPGTPLAALPLGTENLLARYMGFTADAAALVEIIAKGHTMELDAGMAGPRLFTMMAGCGFDAEVVRRLHSERKGNIRHLSYAKPILEAIRQYEYPELRVSYAPADSAPTNSNGDELTAQITARWVFVVNLPRYAGGLSFAPQASGTDGLLDVCTFKEGSLMYGLMYLGGVIFGQHEGMQDFTHIRTKRVRVEAAGRAPFQLDGDPGGELPMDFAIAPRRIRLLVPPSWFEGRSE
jgi:diacylglycerol kinase family enzyme